MIVENDLSNVKLLLVDDDKFLSEVLTTQLQSWMIDNYHLTSASEKI